MELIIKTYETKIVVKTKTRFELPDETIYFFQTGVRRAVRVIPLWTTWQMEQKNKPEEIWAYHFTMVYSSFENKIESLEVRASEFENIYNSGNKNSIVNVFIDNDFNVRTKEQFEVDLYNAIENLNKYI